MSLLLLEFLSLFVSLYLCIFVTFRNRKVTKRFCSFSATTTLRSAYRRKPQRLLYSTWCTFYVTHSATNTLTLSSAQRAVMPGRLCNSQIFAVAEITYILTKPKLTRRVRLCTCKAVVWWHIIQHHDARTSHFMNVKSFEKIHLSHESVGSHEHKNEGR